MIFYEGLESIIECIYLDDSIINKSQESDIFINPENIKYLIGKLVIINSAEYPEENIRILLENNCRIISRIYLDIPEVEVRPYILKINPNIMWNGKYIEKDFLDIDELFEDDECIFDLNSYTLYFPKLNVKNLDIKTKDTYGNLTAIGWALQQVGVNIKTDTPFCNLDVIKTGKVLFD